ncbi:MAG TPA: hypothetical protein VHW67_07220 [Solirubrobacteraceae bacterium]|nr:hypothetical protein [Solirubrobacteraceae bacterium]
MPSVQIKNVPSEVHRTMQRRARAAGQSLQAYMLAQITEQAGKATLKELFDRIGRERGSGRVSPEFAAKVIRDERDARSK